MGEDPIQTPARSSQAYLSPRRKNIRDCQCRSKQLTGTPGGSPTTATWRARSKKNKALGVLAASGTKGYSPGGTQRDPARLGTKGNYHEGQRGSWLSNPEEAGSRNTARRGRVTVYTKVWASLHRQTGVAALREAAVPQDSHPPPLCHLLLRQEKGSYPEGAPPQRLPEASVPAAASAAPRRRPLSATGPRPQPRPSPPLPEGTRLRILRAQTQPTGASNKGQKFHKKHCKSYLFSCSKNRNIKFLNETLGFIFSPEQM